MSMSMSRSLKAQISNQVDYIYIGYLTTVPAQNISTSFEDADTSFVSTTTHLLNGKESKSYQTDLKVARIENIWKQ